MKIFWKSLQEVGKTGDVFAVGWVMLTCLVVHGALETSRDTSLNVTASMQVRDFNSCGCILLIVESRNDRVAIYFGLSIDLPLSMSIVKRRCTILRSDGQFACTSPTLHSYASV